MCVEKIIKILSYKWSLPVTLMCITDDDDDDQDHRKDEDNYHSIDCGHVLNTT